MYCNQCEQTSNGTGCVDIGVCGKDEDVQSLQETLLYGVKGLAAYANHARRLGKTDEEVNAFIEEALFSTLTNVNFDPKAFRLYLTRAAQVRDRARGLCGEACRSAGCEPKSVPWAEEWTPAGDVEGLVAQGRRVGVEPRIEKLGAEIAGLQELIVYGAKGAASYAYHAAVLGKEDDGLYALFHELLAYVAGEPTEADGLLTNALRTGELNLKAMELLDAANTQAYGHPEPTAVRVTPVKGKCIVVSGHDLKDLEELLKQTEGKGINVYTHGEMLPAHGYPGLKKYEHLAGNYGGAWQEQQKEFDAFPGAILMTTNCLMKPRDAYQGRLFTTGPVGWPGIPHLTDGAFASVIEAALAAPGFAEDEPEKTITVGFARNAVLGVADKVIEAVKSGAIRHFFLIGGCDGAKTGRNYYTEFAE